MASALAADAVAALRSAAGGDVSALAALASKVLGYGVVAGAAVLKLPQARPPLRRARPVSAPGLAHLPAPQIAAVLRAGSARGLSAAMFEAEIVGYTVVLAASLQRGLAFNAYGEVVFMLAQNAVLLALIYRSTPPKAARTAALWGAYFAAVAAHVAGARPPHAAPARNKAVRCTPPARSRTPRAHPPFHPPPGAVPAHVVEAAYSASNLVFWYARVPQILANAAARSTGALSGLSTAMQCAGGAGASRGVFGGLRRHATGIDAPRLPSAPQCAS